jgi:acyl-coenzyme A thioesterase PaaI-like protein
MGADTPVAAASTVLHYLHPVRVGPAEARCVVLDGPPDQRVVRVAVHDVGADDRLCALAMVTVQVVTDGDRPTTDGPKPWPPG